MSKCAAVFVFNHKYEDNVAKLDRIYGKRFSEIRYLQPFASNHARDPRIVTVYETSWTFSGHIAQARVEIERLDATHVAFIGDDLIVNPALNESNLVHHLGLAEPTDGYIKNLVFLDALRFRWHRALQETISLRRNAPGFNYEAELPSRHEAVERMRALGIEISGPRPRSWRQMVYAMWALPSKIGWINFPWIFLLWGKGAQYPLVSGYSDFVVVPKDCLDAFLRYCGVFAALGCFAEVAVPTALVLACGKVRTELAPNEHFGSSDSRLSPLGRMGQVGVEFWDAQDASDFAFQFRGSIDSLVTDFPSHALYVHPLKLSSFR